MCGRAPWQCEFPHAGCPNGNHQPRRVSSKKINCASFGNADYTCLLMHRPGGCPYANHTER